MIQDIIPGYNPGVDPTVYEGNVMYSLAEAEKNYCDANYSDQVDCILTRGMNDNPSLEQGRGHKAVEMNSLAIMKPLCLCLTIRMHQEEILQIQM